MKVFGKIALGLALALAIFLPISLTVGCGGKAEKLSIAQSFKTEYYVGEELDISNGILKYVDDEGNTTNVELQEGMISVFSTQKPGNRKMLITYKNETLLVDYTVKPWDVQDNVYYYSADYKLDPDSRGTLFLFNKGKISMYDYARTTPELVPIGIYQITKSFDEDGNIEYRFDGQVPQGDGQQTTVTYTISNITKDSLKMSTTGLSFTLTFYAPAM